MSYIFFLAVLFAFTNLVFGSFNASNLMNKLPAKAGMISAQFNNSIYLFGGANDTFPYGNELYELTLANNTYNWKVLPQINKPNGTINGQGHVKYDGQNLIIMGGVTEANKNSVSNLQIHTYNFASHTWTANANNSAVVSKNDSSILFNREFFSATQAYYLMESYLYIFGGALLDGNTIFADFRKLDENFKVTTLSTPNIGRFGHTASYIRDMTEGKIIVLGGVVREHTDPVNSVVTMDGSTLADMKKALVYTVEFDEWETIDLNPDSDKGYPSSRVGHTAVVSQSYGENGVPGGNNQYLNDIAILDPFSWTWTIPSIPGTPPSSRSYASAGLLHNNILTVAFGESSNNTYYNDINAYNCSNQFWFQNFGELPPNGSGVSKGLIAGVTVAGVVVLLIIIFLLWKFKCCAKFGIPKYQSV